MYNMASMTLYIIVSAATCYFCCLLGKLVEAQIIIVYLVGTAMFFFSDKRSRIISIGISVLTLAVIDANFKWEFIKPLEASENVRYFLRWTAYLVIIALVIFTFDLFRRNNQYLLLKIQQYANEVENNLKLEELENRTKDKFISNASHEMRVSFYSIFSIINIVYKQEKNINIKRGIEDLRAACKYSKSIIDNILEYERYKAGLNTVVIESIDRYQKPSDKHCGYI